MFRTKINPMHAQAMSGATDLWLAFAGIQGSQQVAFSLNSGP